MKRLPPEYAAFLELSPKVPSWVTAMLPPREEAPGVTDTRAALQASPLDEVEVGVAGESEIEGSRWELEVSARGRDGVRRDYRVWMQPTDHLEEEHLGFGKLTEEERAAAGRSRWTLGVSAQFGEEALTDYQEQLRVLDAAAPDAVVAIDLPAFWPRSGDWLRETAASSVPPGPDSLFTVHAVHDEGSAHGAWLHTHGLLRCGSFELEMLEIPPASVSTLSNLINATAAMFIERGPPLPARPFPVGVELELAWLPWEQGIRQLPSDVQGGREDRDFAHSHPAAVLFAPGGPRLWPGRKMRNPAVLTPQLESDPLLYVSNMETRRMALLARERLPAFREWSARQSGSDDWVFLVKLGLLIDGAESETDREHLWFEVHALDEVTLEGTLVNQPRGIQRLNEGDRGRHDLDALSDWTILCPQGRFGPDDVGRLRDD